MKKIGLLSVIIFTTMLVVFAFGQGDMVVVQNDYFPNPQRPPAVFQHDDHNEKADLFDCARCHHVYDEKGRLVEYDSSEDQACADCHGLDDQGRMPGLRKAFHQNCIGCHLEVRQGPFACAQCHVKP